MRRGKWRIATIYRMPKRRSAMTAFVVVSALVFFHAVTNPGKDVVAFKRRRNCRSMLIVFKY